MRSIDAEMSYGTSLTVLGIQASMRDILGHRNPQVHPHVRVGQALFWLGSFDEQHRDFDAYTEAREASEESRILHGLRFARNAVTHGVLAVADITDEDGSPSTVGQWTWRTHEQIVADWPKMKHHLNTEEMLASYSRWTAGRPIEEPLLAAWQWMKSWAEKHYGLELK